MSSRTRNYSILAVVAALAAATAVFASAIPKAQAGVQTRWSLDFRARLEQKAGSPVELHLAGEWIATVVAVRAGDYDAQVEIADLKFLGNPAKNTPANAIEDLRQRLSRPFWATYRADGGLTAIHFFRDVAPADRNLLQMIATELQLVRPDSPRPSWTAQERDGAGEYVAFYVSPQPERILKRKLKYVYTDGVAGPATNAVRVGIDQSEITYTLDASGFTRAVDATSRMHLELSPDHSQKLSMYAEVHAADGHSARAPELVGSLARHAAEVVDSAIITHKTDPAVVLAQADERLLEGRTTESLLAAAFDKINNDTSLTDSLDALFRRRPEAASAAVALLEKNGSEKRVTSALGRAGTADSIAALDRLARNSALAEDLRVDALTALIHVEHPTIEAMRIPAALINDADASVRSAARMMSGAMARAGRTEHAAQAEAIDASLIALYRQSKATNEALEVLSSLGNSVGPSVIPVIEQALQDDRVQVRAAAARALRLAPGPEIDERIASVITADQEATVRSDGIFAARFRQPMPAPIVDALLQAATSDAVDYVRSAAISVLRQNPTASSAIEDTLERVAAKDSNAGIRRQASEALAALFAAPATAR